MKALYINHNPNPAGKHVGDCTVRAVSKALDISWIKAFLCLVIKALIMCDMPSANMVWGSYLKDKGFSSQIIPDYCTVKEFCEDNPKGIYVLSLPGHVVAAIDGDYYDTWDSGDEIINYYYYKEVRQ